MGQWFLVQIIRLGSCIREGLRIVCWACDCPVGVFSSCKPPGSKLMQSVFTKIYCHFSNNQKICKVSREISRLDWSAWRLLTIGFIHFLRKRYHTTPSTKFCSPASSVHASFPGCSGQPLRRVPVDSRIPLDIIASVPTTNRSCRY